MKKLRARLSCVLALLPAGGGAASGHRLRDVDACVNQCAAYHHRALDRAACLITHNFAN